METANLRDTVGLVAQSRHLFKTGLEDGLDVAFAKHVRSKIRPASSAMLESNREKIPHLFKRRANSLQLAEIDEKNEKEINELAERALAEPDAAPSKKPSSRLVFSDYIPAISDVAPETPRKKMKYRESINHALRLALKEYPNAVLFGEDIEDPKGGVLALTKGLSTEFGTRRVFNAPISEEAIMGVAHGRALSGQQVIYEIQFSPFVTPAMTQAAYAIPTSYYHNGINLPLTQIMPYGVVGPGGSGNEHSHCNEAWFYYVSGWKIVFPSDSYEAAGLIAAAVDDPNPVMVYLHIRANNDHEFTRPVPLERFTIPIGKANVKREGKDLKKHTKVALL